MAGITLRNNQKAELKSAGFSYRYIDEWQPKTTLYRHKPSYNIDGEMTADVGTAVKGVPGSPDYVLRKSKIGLFPWPPSVGCACRWCVASAPVPEEEPKGDSGADLSTLTGRSPKKMGPYFQTDS